ncbi:hypothetical protein, partial [Bacillus pumilus]|uniref:hypothetical protein n=1 Tax=Bacillus pumilus TaxID=1408 RepID=UPI001C92F06B
FLFFNEGVGKGGDRDGVGGVWGSWKDWEMFDGLCGVWGLILIRKGVIYGDFDCGDYGGESV